MILFFKILLLPLFAAPSYITFPSDIHWSERSSPHFRILYRQGRDPLAEKILRTAEFHHRNLKPIFPEGPEFTHIVLADFHDALNGYALDFPYPHMVLFLAPPDPKEALTDLEDWLSSIVLHEYVHILHLYPAHGLWSLMRTVFGSWVLPNGLMPSHFHEGAAVFFETQLTRSGRGRGHVFHATQRLLVEANAWNLEKLALDHFESSHTLWPHGMSPYFFGYHLYQELWNRKGGKGISDLTLSQSSNWPYLLSGPLEEVFNVDYTTLWTQYFAASARAVQQEIARIKHSPLSKTTHLTSDGEYKKGVLFSPDGKHFGYHRTHPRWGSQFKIWDAQTKKHLSTFDFESGGIDPYCWEKWKDRPLLLFAQSTSKNNYVLNTLGGHFTDTHEYFSPVFKGYRNGLEHVHQVGCQNDLSALAVYQEEATNGILVDFRRNKEDQFEQNRLWKLPKGSWISSITTFQNRFWFLLRTGLQTELYDWSAEAPKLQLRIPGQGHELKGKVNELLMVATLDGRDEVWAFDPKTQRMVKKIAVLGGINSFDTSNGAWVISEQTTKGYDIAVTQPIASAPRSFQNVKSESVPITLDNTVQVSAPESYSPWATLFPTAWVPSLLIVPDGIQIGAWIPGFDLSQRYFYDLMGGYDTRGLPFASAVLAHRFGGDSTVDLKSYLAPSYLFSTKTFQKRWGGGFGYSQGLDFLSSTIRLGANYRKIEASPLGTANLGVGPEVTITYRDNFKKRPWDVTPVTGTQVSVNHAHYLEAVGSDDNFFSTTAAIDQYVMAPWKDNHAFYIGLRGGYTEGNSLFNSYFSAGGELLFSLARNSFLNRGFDPDFLVSRRIVNLNLEYIFPISTIGRGIGLWPLQLRNLYGALVSDFTTRDLGKAHPRDTFITGRSRFMEIFYTSVGAELRSDWIFSFYLPALVRIGAYHGFGPFGRGVSFVVGLEAGL